MFKNETRTRGLNIQARGYDEPVPDLPAPGLPPWLDADERHAWMSLIAMLMSVPPAIDAQLKRDSGLNFFEYSRVGYGATIATFMSIVILLVALVLLWWQRRSARRDEA